MCRINGMNVLYFYELFYLLTIHSCFPDSVVQYLFLNIKYVVVEVSFFSSC